MEGRRLSFTLRQMEIIRTVAVTGSISDAARFLGVSQPSISATLKQCAQVAQVELFRRSQGRMVPTDEALALLPSLERILDSVEEIDALTGDLQSGDAGTVRIVATHAIALSFLPEAVQSFRQAHRNTRLTIRMMLSSEVVDEVGSGRVDLGLVMSPYEVRGALAVDLWPSEVVCAVPVGHPLSESASATPELLSEYPLISFSRSMPLGRLIDEAFRRRGVRRQIAVEVGPSIMALRLVEQGVGCALVDPFSVARHRGSIKVLRFRPRIKITAQLLTHPTRPASRATTAFIQTIRRTVSPVTV